MAGRTHIDAAIAAATGHSFHMRRETAVSGGCINRAVVLEGEDGTRWFVKSNAAQHAAMFAAEARGLEALARAQAVRVPAVCCTGSADGEAYLVLEYLELTSAAAAAQQRLGLKLAQQHRMTQRDFGFPIDNTIGSTPQRNAMQADWIEFWRHERLGFQLALAAWNGHGGALQAEGERLMADLPAFFTDYRPVPALLHGDLWSGNQAALPDGEPVIFDPAVYYGDREADLAMTELFGGFSAAFYRTYDEAWPLDAGYPVRRALYNLYHVLNHLNLFGGSYHAQALRMLESLRAELNG